MPAKAHDQQGKKKVTSKANVNREQREVRYLHLELPTLTLK